MLVRDLMSQPVVWCTPWDTAQEAASLMKVRGVGAIVVVSDTLDPLLEGIITDRDLCCGVVALGKNPHAIRVADLMSPVPVTCKPEDTLDECAWLMQENQVRRIPVVDDRGRSVGIVAQADIARQGSSKKIAEMLREISEPLRPRPQIRFNKDYFYCGQPHDADQILLLDRRRELMRNPRCSHDFHR